MKRPLDRIDRNILRELQSNARISYVDLGARVGLSTSPSIERVRRLEREGYIKRYGAVLAPELLDAPILVFVEVTLDRIAVDVFKEFSDAVIDVPHILECHMVSGNFDYLLKIRIRTMTAYRELLGEILRKLPGIKDTNSYVVMEEIKESNKLVIGI